LISIDLSAQQDHGFLFAEFEIIYLIVLQLMKVNKVVESSTDSILRLSVLAES